MLLISLQHFALNVNQNTRVNDLGRGRFQVVGLITEPKLPMIEFRLSKALDEGLTAMHYLSLQKVPIYHSKIVIDSATTVIKSPLVYGIIPQTSTDVLGTRERFTAITFICLEAPVILLFTQTNREPWPVILRYI